MSTGDRLDLDAISERAAAATAGPWTDGLTYRSVLAGLATMTGNHGNDAPFVRHARSDVPALVEEVRRLREYVDEQDAALSTMRLDLEFQASAAFANQAEANWLREELGQLGKGWE